jgi:hypothetical protein
MIQRPLFVFCLIFLFVGVFSAQRSVTNADLEKYKQGRLKADQDYRDNYQRLGLPSPEELERRRDASRAESERLYNKIREERLELEKARAVQAAANSQMDSVPRFVPFGVPYTAPGYVFYSNGRFSRSFLGRSRVTQGYFAGGQFWPSGSRTVPRPIVRIGPSRQSMRGVRR